MKKLLKLSPSKVLLLCSLGILMTTVAFWHHQANQAGLSRLTVLNQGISICWGRISQSFTAMMIKDTKSSYLDRGFMALSDECLNEAIKGINPFKREAGKGHDILNKLISEVHWFHEKITKIHSPMLAGQALNTPLGPLSDRYAKMENYKLGLVDEIDAASAQIREVQSNDEILMGIGLLFFVVGLSVLSLQEFNRIQLRREIEREALNLLKSGQANVGALVDRLVDRALSTQEMVVTAQIFKDYHGDLLERVAAKYSMPKKVNAEGPKSEKVEVVEPGPTLDETVAIPTVKTSLKEVLVSLQNLHGQEVMHTSDVREVQLAVEFESCEQMINAAVNKLVEKRINNKKVMISNQVHADRSIINLFLSGNTFTASELEYADGKNVTSDMNDMNMMVLKELATETQTGYFIENKTDRSGNITGMSVRLTLKRTPKEKSKLVSVVKGKKKNLSREMLS